MLINAYKLSKYIINSNHEILLQHALLNCVNNNLGLTELL